MRREGLWCVCGGAVAYTQPAHAHTLATAPSAFPHCPGPETRPACPAIVTSTCPPLTRKLVPPRCAVSPPSTPHLARDLLYAVPPSSKCLLCGCVAEGVGVFPLWLLPCLTQRAVPAGVDPESVNRASSSESGPSVREPSLQQQPGSIGQPKEALANEVRQLICGLNSAADQLVLLYEIGRGGYGVVYKGEPCGCLAEYSASCNHLTWRAPSF